MSYEVFHLLCPICDGQMRVIAFITYSADIHQILEHIGVDSEPPHWYLAAQPAPAFEADQCVKW